MEVDGVRHQSYDEEDYGKLEFATGTRSLPAASDDVVDICDPAFGRRLCSPCCSKSRCVGNMLILLRNRRGKPIVIVGPYWTMLVFVTLPLSVIGPALVATLWCSRLHQGIQLTYAALVAFVAIALLATALRDPGILLRHASAPDETWTWNDQARTFKPPNARYCPWCDCVLESFDHTCPWTGTAIAKNNIASFRCFVGFIQLLAYYTAAVFLIGALHVADRN